ncbi:hypothetical protein [Ferrovum myxofaciens]|nr:hypothetical protein [Ferrovum myxofaciens]MBU6995850.1 hypothetical protein [Ferrovum myxofaciens]
MPKIAKALGALEVSRLSGEGLHAVGGWLDYTFGLTADPEHGCYGSK